MNGIFSTEWYTICSYLFELIGMTLFVYLLEKKIKLLFFLENQTFSNSLLKSDYINNLQCALIIFEHKSISYNSKFQEILSLDEDEQSNREKINFFFSAPYEEINEKIEFATRELFNNKFENLNEKIEKIFEFVKNHTDYQEIRYIATKCVQCNGVKIYSHIKMCYNKLQNHVEIYLLDVTPLYTVEDLKISEKIKKMFLNKFSHEFKNPLLNILGLIENIKNKFKENFTTEKKNTFKTIFTNISNISSNDITNSNIRPISYQSVLPNSQTNSNFDKIDFRNIGHIKNLTNFMISLIGDFDFLSNSDLTSANSEFSNKFISSASKFNVEKLVKSCIKIFETRSELNDKNVLFFYQVDQDIPKLNSDYRRINQIFLNLLSNAYKFTSNGEISIKIKNVKEFPDIVSVSVTDTGSGFSKELLEKYNNFSCDEKENKQVKQINQNNIYGMGLGLKIVKFLISKLGRNFKIESNPREGSRISFQLFKDIKNDNKVLEFISPEKIIKRPVISNRTRRGSFKSESKHYSSFCKTSIKKGAVESTSFKRTSSYYMKSKTQRKSFIYNAPNLMENYNSKDMNVNESNQDLIYKPKHEESLLGTVILPHINLNIAENLKITGYAENSFEDITEGKIIHLNEGCHKKESFKDSKSNEHTYIHNESNFQNASFINQPAMNENSLDNYNIDRIISSDRRPLRIILVEDEKLIRNSEHSMIEKFFNKINRQVEIVDCTDGVECLYLLYKGQQGRIKYDYIITDETMNFMRGSLMVQTIKSLINDNLMYLVKIFMLTSYESSTILERYGNIVDGIITKPLSKENISIIFNDII